MATIKPTLKLAANNNVTTVSPGPMATPINLSTAALSLTVDDAVHFTIESVRTAVDGTDDDKDGPYGQVLLDGSDYTASSHSDGTTLDHHGAWVYLLNTTASTSKHVIAVGHTTDADVGSGDGFTALVDGNNNTHADANQRLFSLRAGEWAFFPYDYTGDLYAQATAASQSLEVWIFHRTQ